ncbi:hypothetical protein V8C34DRAFT_276157 [Trichoderma compactum]
MKILTCILRKSRASYPCTVDSMYPPPVIPPSTPLPGPVPYTPLPALSPIAKMNKPTLETKIRTAMNQFLYPGKTSPEAKQALLRHMNTRPISADAKPIVSSEEIEPRLKLVIEIQKIYDESACKIQRSDDGRFQFTALQMAYLLLMPMEHLQNIRATPMVPYLPYLKLETYVSFMTRCIMPEDVFADTSSASQTLDHTYTPPATSTMNIGQNANERAKCLARDGGACILTGAAIPDVCHIVPFEINSSEQNLAHYRDQFFLLTHLVRKGDYTRVMGLLDSGLGCSDKAWNMLCLHPTLGDWWSKGFFGLQCTGIGPTSCAGLGPDHNYTGSYLVKLQFHWMPRNNGVHPRDYTQPGQDTIRKMLQIKERYDDTISEAQKSGSCRLETGQIFTLSVSSREDATKMQQMIDIQWANVRLAAMSGLSGNLGLPNHSQESNVLSWSRNGWESYLYDPC